MFSNRTAGFLFIALLICGTFARTSTTCPSVKGRKSVSSTCGTTGSRWVGKHEAIINRPKILVKKSRGASGKSKPASYCSAPKKSSCRPGKPDLTQTVCGQKTIFQDTWETIGQCTRTWQKIKQVDTTVDTIVCKSVCVDVTTQEKVNWQILSTHKAPQRVIRRVRTHINVLRPKKVNYQTLVCQHVEYQAVENQNVCVQTYAKRSACVGALANKRVNQRVIHEQQVCARTLTNAKVNIKKVKKVNEQVSQSLYNTSTCLGIRNGNSIHNKNTSSGKCVPKKSCSPKPKSCW